MSLKGFILRGAITARNRWLVDNCDLLVAYVKNRFSGAGQTLRYAEKTGTRVLNLAEMGKYKF